jgi:hypothetical protein
LNCVLCEETIVASNETNQEEVYVSKVVILMPNVMFANDNHQMLINIERMGVRFKDISLHIPLIFNLSLASSPFPLHVNKGWVFFCPIFHYNSQIVVEIIS